MFENYRVFETDFAGRPLKIETGKMAQLANASCLVRYGETVVHVAVTASAKPRDGIDFFPLSVDFEEKLYSVAAVTHGGIIAGLLASMGLPQREAVRWSVGPGEGYTLLLTPQMWMRDQKFEVYGRLPLPRELFAEQADWYCL